MGRPAQFVNALLNGMLIVPLICPSANSREVRVSTIMDRNKILASGAFSLESYAEMTPPEIAKLVDDGFVHVLDVRNLTEWQEGHIPNSQHIMLGTLPERSGSVPSMMCCEFGI